MRSGGRSAAAIIGFLAAFAVTFAAVRKAQSIPGLQSKFSPQIFSAWDSANRFLNELFLPSEPSILSNTADWTGRLHIGADLAIALLTLTLSLTTIRCLRRDGGIPHARALLVFSFFGIGCSVLHLLDGAMAWWPAYRLLAVVKLGCALLSFAALVMLLPIIPKFLAMRSPTELQQEITQRRRTEFELRQVHAQLESIIEQRTGELALKNEEMEQFLNTVTHDLKSPVVTCLGLTEMLREDLAAGRIQESQDSIGRIDRSVNRMRALIEALLDLSRIGRVRFDIAELDMQSLIRSIGEDLRPRFERAGVTFKVESGLPPIRGDAHWLTEVFENLIINALKYGCDNAKPVIEVGAILDGNDRRFFVRDNGRGIDPSQHQTIFEPFKRLQTDREGSGMGLAIVARIIKMHGGRVWIESERGQGATFWIALPNSLPTSSNDTICRSKP
jgi:signal transduction histidine kinase